MRRLRASLQRSLFVPYPEDEWRPRGWEAWLVVVAFLVLASALQLFRMGPTATLESIWAEDGPIFLGGAIVHGPLDLLATPYNGYLVVVQRLVGDLGALVPLPDAATAMALVATVIISLSGLVVWVASAGHIRSPVLRGLLVALTVLSPVAGLEAVVSGTYVCWYMSFAVFWLLLWQPRTTWSACLAGAFILLTGLSGPITFFFLPLALLRAAAIRDRRDAIIVGSYAVAIAIQVPVTLVNEVPPPEGRTFTDHIWTVFLQRIVDGSTLGLELGSSAWESWGWPLLVGLTIALAAYLLVLAPRARGGRLLAAIALVTALVMFVVSIYQRAVTLTMLWPTGGSNVFGGRYSIVPSLLLISAVFVLLDRQEWSPRVWRGAMGATVAVLLVALATSLDTGDRGGPRWRDAVEAAALRCEIKGQPEDAVHITPVGWAVYLPCDEIVSGDWARAASP
jgi:hypothetical protein